ncbi:MAG: hypothetical protein HZC42_10005 [Candidatus Eisenbacteria bacterium]|nr:hypothetical protein [Candidatus Eisenbacteria bacterium]
MYLADQKVPVRVARMRGQHVGRKVRLALYVRLQALRNGDAQLMGRVPRGLGCSNYYDCPRRCRGVSSGPAARRCGVSAR